LILFGLQNIFRYPLGLFISFVYLLISYYSVGKVQFTVDR